MWRAVNGYEDSYEVSDAGGVRNVRTGRELNPYDNGQGYRMVRLSVRGDTRAFRVHRLVASAFLPLPVGQFEVCHNNGDRSDNRAANLRWDTRSGNLADMRAHGTHHYGSRQACSNGHAYADGDWEWVADPGFRRCKACARVRAGKFNEKRRLAENGSK